MKVLLTTDRYYPYVSGVITSVMNLAKELEKKGHEVKILTLSETKSTYVSGNIIYVGSFDAGKIYPDIRLKHVIKRKVINEIIDWKPEIIHSNCEFSTFFLAKIIARSCKVPMVHTYHTDYEDYVHYVAMTKEMGMHIVKRYIHYVSSYMQRLICPTQKTAAILSKYNIQVPMDIIPTGLDLERFEAELPINRRAEIITKYGLNPTLPVLLFIGRIGKEKNIEEILGLLEKNPRKDYQFLIVGDGPNKAELENKVANSSLKGRVTFTGMVPQAEIADYYKLGKIFISASQSETQGLTYIEALSSGVPLICKKDDCLTNVILQGYNGFQYETAQDFDKYLNYLLDLSQEEYAKLSAFAKENAHKTFSSTVFCDKVLTCYDAAIKKPIASRFFKDLYYHISKAFPFV